FIIAWNVGTDQSLIWRVARGGTHTYEMRHLAKWKGPIDVIATTLQVPGRIKEPDFSDEIDMFLEPERVTASTVNGLIGHTLFGVQLETILLIVFLACAVVVAIFMKQRLAVALVLGFVMSLTLMDARSVYDDAVTMVRGHRATGPEMFSDRAAKIISKG